MAEGKKRHVIGLGTTLQPTGSLFKGDFSLSVVLLFLPVWGEHISTLAEDSGAHRTETAMLGTQIGGLFSGPTAGPLMSSALWSLYWSTVIGSGGLEDGRPVTALEELAAQLAQDILLKHLSSHEQDIINHQVRLHQPLPPLPGDEYGRQTSPVLPRHEADQSCCHFRNYLMWRFRFSTNTN